MKIKLLLLLFSLTTTAVFGQLQTDFSIIALTTGHFTDSQPSYSSDGKSILFESNRLGLSQVFLLDLSSNQIVQLTHTNANNGNPSWHPDGTHIVFDSDISGLKQIYLLNPDKQANRKLFKREVEAFDGRLNSNNNLLVFIGKGSNEKYWNVYSYDFKYNNLNKITHHNTNCYSPRWSPDAAYISYYKQFDHQTFEPDIIHWYGKKAFESALQYPNMHGINWSPDGYKIVFVTKSTDLYELYMSRRDGSEPRQLASSSFRLSQPDWSPDGSRIVFCVDEGYGKQNLWLINLLE